MRQLQEAFENWSTSAGLALEKARQLEGGEHVVNELVPLERELREAAQILRRGDEAEAEEEGELQQRIDQ
jgi:hypothetical protein